jgi:putative membrane protein (TIGR04086 family)
MKNTNGGFIGGVIKGSFCAVIVTLISVLIFAFVISSAMLTDNVIKSVNQFIKILSVFLGCMFFVRGSAGLLRGALIGAISTLITYLLFSLFGSQMQFGFPFIIDLVFLLVVGGISGVIAVNVKKE